MKENSLFDKKSLKIISGKTADWNELAKDCVSFANAEGGEIHIGIEDNQKLPSENQKINTELLDKIQKQIPSRTMNVSVTPRIEVAKNGGEYIVVTIAGNKDTIASTSKGRYYIRVADDCKPVLPDELPRLIADKTSFVWEEKVIKKIHYQESDSEQLKQFVNDINKSERVSRFVKEMSIEEKLEYYSLTDSEGMLTNLGIFWI